MAIRTYSCVEEEQEELKKIDKYCKELGVNRSALIVRLLKAWYKEIRNGSRAI